MHSIEKHIPCSRCKHKILLKYSSTLLQPEAAIDKLRVFDILCCHCKKEFEREREEYFARDFITHHDIKQFERDKICVKKQEKKFQSTSEIESKIINNTLQSYIDKIKQIPSIIPIKQKPLDERNEQFSLSDNLPLKEKKLQFASEEIENKQQIKTCYPKDSLSTLDTIRMQEEICKACMSLKSKEENGEEQTNLYVKQSEIGSSVVVTDMTDDFNYVFLKNLQDEDITLKNYKTSSEIINELRVKQDRIDDKLSTRGARLGTKGDKLGTKGDKLGTTGDKLGTRGDKFGTRDDKYLSEKNKTKLKNKPKQKLEAKRTKEQREQGYKRSLDIQKYKKPTKMNTEKELMNRKEEKRKDKNDSLKKDKLKPNRKNKKKELQTNNKENLMGDDTSPKKKVTPAKPEKIKQKAISELNDDVQQVFKINRNSSENETQEAGNDEPKGLIRYSLSDRTYIDKGWTTLPTEKVVRKMNVYRMRPAHPEFNWFENNKNKRLLNFDTGEKLAEIGDDGRGRWFYRNGKLALDYYDSEELNSQQRIVVYSNGEPDEHGRSRPLTVLATFDHLGNGIVFDHSGKIRLKYNQTEGILLDRSIGPVSHWKWHTLNDPPVLQQVMIETQMEQDPDIMRLGETNETKKEDNEDMLAIEFENFIKEKSKRLSQKFKPFQIKMKALKINENFSLKILDQATVHLLYRDGLNNLKLNLGMILDNKEIIDTDLADVGEISNNLERLPAKTDSLAAMQKSVKHAQRVQQARIERERRFRDPSASLEKLTAAVSRPLRQQLYSDTTNVANSICQCSRYTKFCCNLYYDTRLI